LDADGGRGGVRRCGGCGAIRQEDAMKRLWRIGLVIVIVLLSGCRNRLVIERGGIGRESDVMIAEAAQNSK